MTQPRSEPQAAPLSTLPHGTRSYKERWGQSGMLPRSAAVGRYVAALVAALFQPRAARPPMLSHFARPFATMRQHYRAESEALLVFQQRRVPQASASRETCQERNSVLVALCGCGAFDDHVMVAK